MTCACGRPSATESTKTATLVIRAEFDIDDGLFVPDILECISRAVDELRSYGNVKTATLTMPATEMDLT